MKISLTHIFIVFVSTNMKDAIDSYFEMDLKYYMLITLFPLACLMFISNLRYLAPFSACANLATFFGEKIVSYE